jgi:hypothetical protein
MSGGVLIVVSYLEPRVGVGSLNSFAIFKSLVDPKLDLIEWAKKKKAEKKRKKKGRKIIM